MATYAAAKGANVYMVCRSQERAEKAQREIVELTSNPNIKVLLVGESPSIIVIFLSSHEVVTMTIYFSFLNFNPEHVRQM